MIDSLDRDIFSSIVIYVMYMYNAANNNVLITDRYGNVKMNVTLNAALIPSGAFQNIASSDVVSLGNFGSSTGIVGTVHCFSLFKTFIGAANVAAVSAKCRQYSCKLWI